MQQEHTVFLFLEVLTSLVFVRQEANSLELAVLLIRRISVTPMFYIKSRLSKISSGILNTIIS